MQSNDGKNHIEDAWNVCRTWFGRYGKESDQEIYLLFREVRPSRLRSGFKTLEREKAGCYGYHRVEGGGGAVGPDLSRIGAIRWRETSWNRSSFRAPLWPKTTVLT